MLNKVFGLVEYRKPPYGPKFLEVWIIWRLDKASCSKGEIGRNGIVIASKVTAGSLTNLVT